MTLPPDFDPLDERYRWCIYCRADCWPEPDAQRHAATCPLVTGMYPVTEQERGPDGGLPLCCRCATPLALGDHYTLIDMETGGPATRPDYGEAVCLGCAAGALTTTEE